MWLIAMTCFQSTCVLSVEPVVREYTLNVQYFKVDPDHWGAVYVQGINGQLPGPEIRVRQHERLRVTVNNQLATEVLSIHWHGFEMRTAQEYDGAMQLTQCGIKPGHTFVYDFIVDEHPGTYQYHEHAHLEHVAARGLFGPLIVDPPAGEVEPWEYSRDVMVLLFDWWPYSPHGVEMAKWAGLTRPNTVSRDLNDVGLMPFHNLLINGKGGYAVFNPNFGELNVGMVTPHTHVDELFTIVPNAGETWRLRVENGGALFAVTFRIDGHRFQVIQADAADVQPYWCDVLSMATGERFDILVNFDQTPGSYWMRTETLEEAYGFHHGQLAVVRYAGTAEGILPNKGYALRHQTLEAPHLVTINCIDQGPISDMCRPITDLRQKHRDGVHIDVGDLGDETHDYEIAFRAYGKPDDSHFTRLIDLTKEKNNLTNQFDGDYVQFMPPALPFSHTGGTEAALHPNSLPMHVAIGETVRVILQIQDRVQHPWHLHGHKFAVLATGFPNYSEDCDVVFCRNKPESGWWARDGMPDLLDPHEAPLKDTVNIPPGGYAIIQFKADNPGWWFFHCHMLIHVHDGMAVILIEGDSSNFPKRTYDLDYLAEKGFPTCEDEIETFSDKGHYGTSCSCWENPEIHLDTQLRSNYKCGKEYLCGLTHFGPLEPTTESRMGPRNRADGRQWRLALLSTEIAAVVLLFYVLHVVQQRAQVAAKLLQAHVHRSMKSRPCAEKKISGKWKSEGNVANMSNLRRDMDVSWVVRQVTPSGFTQHHSSLIEGSLPAGSVFVVLGKTAATDPWLRFFAGRQPKGCLAVLGKLVLGDTEECMWDKDSLRNVRSFIHDILPIRPNCSVVAFLDVVLQLTYAPTLYTNKTERLDHLSKMMNLFGLIEHAHEKCGDVSKEVLLRVSLCRELLLPRPLLMVKEPLSGLDAKGAARMMDLFKTLAKQMGITIVFSAMTMAGEAAQTCTHALACVSGYMPIYGSEEQWRDMCDRDQHPPVPAGANAIEHTSNLLFTGNLVLEEDMGFHRASMRSSDSLNSMASAAAAAVQLGRSSVRGAGAEWQALVKPVDVKVDFNSAVPNGSPHSNLPIRRVVPYGSPKGSPHGTPRSQNDENDSNVTPVPVAAPAARPPVNKPTAIIADLPDASKEQPENYRPAIAVAAMKLRKVGTADYGAKGSNQSMYLQHRRRHVLVQLWILLKYQAASDLNEYMTVYKFAETFGIGVCAGIVWFQKNADETQTALTEVVGLMFFSTALWTVPPVFQSLNGSFPIFIRFVVECYSGLYPLWVGVFVLSVSTFMFSMVWVCVWQSIAYTMADLGPNLGAMLMMHLTLSMNVFAMRTIGLVLGLVVPNGMLNTVIANLVAQLCMLTNGFYTKLPDWFNGITHFSIPRYTFRALLKLEYTWRDTFVVHPMLGLGGAGYPSKFLLAEFTGFFQLMRTREMEVMKSPEEATALPEILMMFCISMAGLSLYLLALTYRLGSLEAKPASKRGLLDRIMRRST